MNSSCLILTFFSGEPLPEIEYTEIEHNTWKHAYLALKDLRESHTCVEYQKNVKIMEDLGIITADRIPSLRKLNSYVQSKSQKRYLRSFL